jgi:hypothetical protein
VGPEERGDSRRRDRKKKFIGIDEGHPEGQIAKPSQCVIKQTDLNAAAGPRQIRHVSGAQIRPNPGSGVIARPVIIQEKMISADDQMIFQPLRKVVRLVPDGNDD